MVSSTFFMESALPADILKLYPGACGNHGRRNAGDIIENWSSTTDSHGPR